MNGCAPLQEDVLLDGVGRAQVVFDAVVEGILQLLQVIHCPSALPQSTWGGRAPAEAGMSSRDVSMFGAVIEGLPSSCCRCALPTQQQGPEQASRCSNPKRNFLVVMLHQLGNHSIALCRAAAGSGGEVARNKTSLLELVIFLL